MTRLTSLIALSIIGLIDSLYITYLHLSHGEGCKIGCNKVLSSEWSSLFGIPLSVLGIGLFISILVLSVYQSRSKDQRSWAPLTLLIFFGTLASLGLVMIQALFINAFCPYCLITFGVLVAMFILVFTHHHQNEGADLIDFKTPLVKHLIPIGLAFATPIVIYLLIQSPFIADRSPVVAIVGGEKVRLKDIDQGLGFAKFEIDEALNNKREEWINKRLLYLEAQKEGLTLDEYIEKEVRSRIQISDQEAEQFFTANQSQFPTEMTPRIRDNIKRYLQVQKQQPLLSELIATLRIAYRVSIDLPRPSRIIMPANPAGSPTYGHLNANEVLEVFSDFQCPYCAKTHTDIHNALKKDPTAFKVVYRYFPLRNHKHAKPAAQAAFCANEQGKFEALADAMYAQQKKLNKTFIETLATQQGLNMDAFNACLDSDRAINAVEFDKQHGSDLGVKSTPTLLLNGYQIKTIPGAI